MTERGLPTVDGSPACPFVAFEDDRDERAPVPDHRHRCYAEIQPAPRALAHQEAYCLSSAFPVCPTFQEWARREAAHASRSTMGPSASAEAAAVGPAAGAASVSPAAPGAAGASGELGHEDDDIDGPVADDHDADEQFDERDVPIEQTPRRNPRRDWAAPPPWASGTGARGGAGASDRRPDEAPEVVARRAEGQGLAGSAADRIAAGERVILPPPADEAAAAAGIPSARVRSAAPDPELAGLVGGRPVPPPPVEPQPMRRPGRPRTVSSSRSGPERARERARDRDLQAEVVHDGPAWERGRRFEAYPQIKTPRGMPDLPRVAVLAIALGVAALAVFFLPALFVGNKAGPSPTPGTSQVVASASPDVTVAPAPTQQVYTIKSGDNLSRIASKYGLTLAQLLAANKSIKDPNKIKVGDQIIIPSPSSNPGAGASASP